MFSFESIFFTSVLEVVVLCLYPSTTVASLLVDSDALYEEGGVDLKLVIPILLRIIIFKRLHRLIATN